MQCGNNTWQQPETEALYNHPCPASKMMQLKNQFFHVVNSNRTLDRTRDIRGLIKILEKRDELTDEHLGLIAEIVNFSRAAQACSSNGNDRRRRTTDVPLRSTRSKTRNDDLTFVYEVIQNHLGEHWIDFARFLDMPEADIDRLGKKTNTKLIIIEVLDYHEKHCDPHTWRQKLLTALEKARRKELSLKVAAHLDRFSIIDFQRCYS